MQKKYLLNHSLLILIRNKHTGLSAPLISTARVPGIDTDAHLPLQQIDWQGFIYLLSGFGVFGLNNMTVNKGDYLVLGKEAAHELSVKNNSAEQLEFVMLTGQPHHKPFYKILGGGGALIADTEEHARAALQRFEQAGEKFGCD